MTPTKPTELEFVRARRAKVSDRLAILEPEQQALRDELVCLVAAENVLLKYAETYGQDQPHEPVKPAQPAVPRRRQKAAAPSNGEDKPVYANLVIEALERHPHGATADDIRTSVENIFPSARPNIIAVAINRHVKAGRIVHDGESYWLPERKVDTADEPVMEHHQTEPDESKNWRGDEAAE